MTNNNDGQLWIARDKVGVLKLFDSIPKRDEPYGIWVNAWCLNLNNDLFPDLKWEDEPFPVKVVGLQIDEKKLAKKTLEEALTAKFCGFIPEGETPGLTDLNIFEYAYKLGVIQTLGLFKKPSDLMSIEQMEKENEKDNNEAN